MILYLVLLCFAAPSWRAIPQCVPPIRQVLRDLARSRAFPTCAMSGPANSASHQWASAATNCPAQYTVLTGGIGLAQLRSFYATRFIPQMPPDTRVTPVSRTIGHDQIVDEMIFAFTHSIAMDWMLPGLAPTGRRVEVPLVAVVRFRAGKVAHEHIYWDQASVLVQIGLLLPAGLPVAGIESARKVLDPQLPARSWE